MKGNNWSGRLIALGSLSLMILGISGHRTVESIAAVSAPQATANIVIDFDGIDTSASPGTVGGPTLDRYLADFGVSITNVSNGPVTVQNANFAYGGGVVGPSSPPNYLQLSGSASFETSFTLSFQQPVDSVSFTFAAILLPSVVPQWSATALDSAGNSLSSVGNGLMAGEFHATPYSLNGPGISAVRFDGFGFGFAAWSGPLIDDLTLVRPTCQVNLQVPPLPYHQFDLPWAPDIYAFHSATEDGSARCPKSKRPTVQCLGCALTVLSMALYHAGITQFPAPDGAIGPTPNNPRFLNTFMQGHIGDYTQGSLNPDDNNNVDFFNTTLDVGVATGILSNKTFIFDDITFGGSTSTDDLRQALCGGPNGPVPVIVKVMGTSHDHYVLVTGAQPQPDGSVKFTIVDPGHGEITTLDAYKNNFEIRGFVEDPAGDVSALSLAIGNEADLLLLDDSGRRTGFDVTNGIVKEIPESTYARDALGSDETIGAPAEIAHSIHILQPQQGPYSVLVTGLQLGQYKFVVRAFSQNGTAQPALVVEGIAGVGSTSSFHLLFLSTPGAVTGVARVASFQSTLSDISNGLQLGLIDNRGIANSLSQKLQAAMNASGTARANILNAFRQEINAQAGKHVTGIAVQVLLEDADSLLSQ